MEHLRRLHVERPWLFWGLAALAFYLAFRLVLFVAALVLGPFGLPGWAPVAVVVGILVLVAHRQQRSR